MRRIVVRRSPVHGRGVFALTNIPSGELLLEYKGEVTSWRVASQRYQRDRAEGGHTFFFGLDDGHVIDSARGGKSARWLNHRCEPNGGVVQEGSRVFIRALADSGPVSTSKLEHSDSIPTNKSAVDSQRPLGVIVSRISRSTFDTVDMHADP